MITLAMEFSKEQLLPDIRFKTSRSGGKGGQNVNKVSTKAELNFDFEASGLFSREQKDLIRVKLVSKIIGEELIQVISEEERSQYRNKERCIEKLIKLLEKAIHIPVKRRATKPSKSSVEERIKEKRTRAIKKLNRKKNFDW